MSEREDVERILASIQPLPRARAWPALIMLVGPPGAGKSTLGQRIRDRTPVVVLCIDDVRQLLIPDADFSFGETQRIQRAVRLALGELLRGNITVVLDAPNLTEWERQPLYSLAELHQARLIIVEVTAPTSVVLERLAVSAPHEVAVSSTVNQTPQDVYHLMVQRQEPITREHSTVDTSSPDIEQFVAALALDLDEG